MVPVRNYEVSDVAKEFPRFREMHVRGIRVCKLGTCDVGVSKYPNRYTPYPTTPKP